MGLRRWGRLGMCFLGLYAFKTRATLPRSIGIVLKGFNSRREDPTKITFPF